MLANRTQTLTVRSLKPSYTADKLAQGHETIFDLETYTKRNVY
jgi:hypothetical protein